MQSILIVEDEQIVALDLQQDLYLMGYDVTGIACSGEDALRQVTASLPDLALVDIKLSGQMDGIEAADKIQKLFGVPVVFLTAHSDPKTLLLAKTVSPYGYLVKPFERATLHTTVEVALQRHQVDSSRQLGIEHLDGFLRALPDGVIATDSSGTICYINPAAAALLETDLKWSRGKLLPELVQVLDDHDQPLREELVAQVVRTGRPAWLTASCLLKHDSGAKRVLDIAVSPVRKPQENEISGAMLVIRDAAACGRAEERDYQLRQLESLRRLAGGLAHEFNNSLTVIAGSAELLMSSFEPGDPGIGKIENIRRAVRESSDLTRVLLAFSQGQILRPLAVDLNQMLETFHRLMSDAAGKSRLKLSLTPCLKPVFMDPHKLQEAIMTLLRTVADSMPGGGELLVGTIPCSVTPDDRQGNADVPPADYVVLQIGDARHSMSAEVKTHIFEPFITSSRGQHTGLALATVYGIIKQSGGHLAAHHSGTGGTLFRCYLPPFESSSNLVPVHAPGDHVIAQGTETILLVESDDAVRRFTWEVLEHQGYMVLEAAHEDEALKICGNYPAPIHLLLTEVASQDGNHPLLARQFHSRFPASHVLYTSVHLPYGLIRHGSMAEGTAVVQKPYSARDLARRVREVLDNK